MYPVEPGIFIPPFLWACLFALLLGKGRSQNIQIARGEGHCQPPALLSGLSTHLSCKWGSKENKHELSA